MGRCKKDVFLMVCLVSCELGVRNYEFLEDAVTAIMAGFVLREMDFVLREIDFVLREMDFVLREMDFVLRETDFVLREADFVLREAGVVLRETGVVLRETDFVLREMDFVLRETDFVLREMDFVLREMDFVLRETDFVLREGWVWRFNGVFCQKVRLRVNCEWGLLPAFFKAEWEGLCAKCPWPALGKGDLHFSNICRIGVGEGRG